MSTVSLKDRVGVAVTRLNDSMVGATTEATRQLHRAYSFFTAVTVLAAIVLSVVMLCEHPSKFASAWSIFTLVVSVLAALATLAHLVRPCAR